MAKTPLDFASEGHPMRHTASLYILDSMQGILVQLDLRSCFSLL
jgi:hypothetical protein